MAEWVHESGDDSLPDASEEELVDSEGCRDAARAFDFLLGTSTESGSAEGACRTSAKTTRRG